MKATLESIIININSLQEKINSISKNKNWDKEFIEKVKIDFTYNSNKLEGNTLTYGETISFLKNITVPQKNLKDLLDIQNHQKILEKVLDQYEKPFSVTYIKEIHKELMKDADQWDYDALPNPGQFKIFENFSILPSGKIKKYMQPDMVEASIEELISNINTKLEEADITKINKHPLVIATEFHHRFLNEIHPFQDGNGRMGRIFMNLILLKCKFPPIFIETSDKVERGEYLAKIQESEQKNDLTPMIIYCGKKLIDSLNKKYAYIK